VFYFPVIFSRNFLPYFLLSSSTKMLVGVFSTTSASYNHRKLPPPLLFSYIRCSLRRPRPMYIGNFPLFSNIRCSLRRPRPITYELALIIIC
jgi:hypothetical protein